MKRIKIEEDSNEPIPVSFYFCLSFGIIVSILSVIVDIIKIRGM